MRIIWCAMAAILPLSSFAGSQPATVVDARRIEPAPSCIVPPDSLIDFAIVEHLGSKLSRTGDVFHIRALGLVDASGQTLVPPGATGIGEVIHAARARAGGKAGELILTVRYLDCTGLRIPLRKFRFGRRGDSQTNSAFALAIVGGPLAYLVVGGEVDVPTGTVGFATVAGDAVRRPSEHHVSTSLEGVAK